MVAHNVMVVIMETVWHVTLKPVQLLYMADGVIGPTVIVLEPVEVEPKLALDPAPIQRKFYYQLFP